MATKILTYEQIIEQARASWPGQIGEERAESVKNILDTRLENYHAVTGISKDEILIAFEKRRNVNTVNFYQEANFPLLENVTVFDTLEDFKKAFPSGKYLCPKCEKQSTNPFLCSQPKCDWSVNGLFRDLGKGITIIIKESFLEHPVPINIFKPIELI